MSSLERKDDERSARLLEESRSGKERAVTEEALRSLRRHYELILNSAGEGIYGLDLGGNFNFINPKAAELLGWKADELLGKPAHATIHHTKSDGSPYPIESCPIHESMRAAATQRVTNDVLWRKNGTSFHVDYVSAPIKDEAGEIAGAIVTFRDITEEFEAELRLKLQEQQYRLLFETNPSPMWVFDTRSLQILAVNEEAIKQYGYSREEFLKLTMEQLRPAEDVPHLEKALTGSELATHDTGQFRHKKKDGALILVDIYSGALMWEGAASRIVTAIDVTERVRAGKRLQEEAGIPTSAPHALTARERETVRLLAEGASNKEVAAALGISVRTAETKRARLLRKLGLDSLAALVRYAIRNDIIQP